MSNNNYESTLNSLEQDQQNRGISEVKQIESIKIKLNSLLRTMNL